MTATGQQFFMPVAQYVQSLIPANVVQLPDISLFDDIWMEPPNLKTDPSLSLELALWFGTSLEIGIPGLDAVSLVIAPDGDGTEFVLQFATQPDVALSLVDVPIAIRFSNEILQPAKKVPGQDGGADTWEVDTSVDYVDIELAQVTLSVDADGNFTVKTDLDINMPPAMIGNTGVVIEVQDVAFYLDANNPPPGKPNGWRGVHIGNAAVHLPGGLSGSIGTLQMTDAYIGNGGFSGTVSDTWSPALSATIFGMDFTLQSVALTFVQNAMTASSIAGAVTLPFFDQPLAVEIALSISGAFSVAISDPSGVLTLTKPGILSIDVNGIGFAEANGVFTVTISGSVTPLIAADELNWPSFELKSLSIDSQGNVHLDGGWIDLPSQYALSFYGFSIEITKLGLGKTDDGGKWIGFSGALNLVSGLSAGASVKGLQLTWYDDGRSPSISLDGVGVSFEIPGVLDFSGSISYGSPQPGVHEFTGNIDLNLECLGFEIDGSLVIGSAPGYTFFAIYLDCELPAGIPLWTTGLGLYGMAGLYAQNMVPNRQPQDQWYDIGSTTDWYHNSWSPPNTYAPDVGVTDLGGKWMNANDAFAFGAGVTLGTEPDNGFTFSGKLLLVLSFPGPVILIQGAANLLKERSDLDGSDPMFQALAVLDFQSGTFLVGLDFEFKYDEDDAALIDIGGSCEAYFSLSDPSAWHLYLGEKDPMSKRIHANLFFDIFQSNSYFMLDAHQLAMGGYIGYGKSWSFGPLSVTVEAWLSGDAAVSWRPLEFYGDVWLHGKAALSVFGFGIGLSVDAKLACQVFTPFSIDASLSVSLSLPWPLPNVSADISLSWGPQPTEPPIPMPLKEIAVGHFKVTTTWPLPRTSSPPLLVPNYQNTVAGYFDQYPPAAIAAVQPVASAIPVVPLDARPHLTFARNVHDVANVGNNSWVVTPSFELIGDPSQNQGTTQITYSLVQLDLHSFDGTNWNLVASAGDASAPPSTPQLYGSWAPMPSMPDGGDNTPGQTKLWLWSKTPFQYTSGSSSTWDQWFTNQYPNYPCIPAPPTRTYCFTFRDMRVGELLATPYVNEPADLAIIWEKGQVAVVGAITDRESGAGLELCLTPPRWSPVFGAADGLTVEVAVVIGRPALSITVTYATAGGTISATGFDGDDTEFGPVTGSNGTVTVTGEGLIAVTLVARGTVCLREICYVIGEDQAGANARNSTEQQNNDKLSLWSQTGEVLQPNTLYRLSVTTSVQTANQSYDGGSAPQILEMAYFQTQGPPGITTLSTPINAQSPQTFKSGLDDLSGYVQQTVPATVPASGQKPVLTKPVYRGYDVGVQFNEDYVDEMYRLEGRDLGLYLFDANNQPVRNAAGAVIVLNNAWGNAPVVTLTQSEQTWINTVNTCTCASLDTATIPTDVNLGTAGQVLSADTVYEARLTPLLLHETFAAYTPGTIVTGPSGTLGSWMIVDENTSGGPSSWTVTTIGTPSMDAIVQTTGITAAALLYGGPASGSDPNEPANWTDYRLTAIVGSTHDGAVGLLFRYVDEQTYYRLSLDRKHGYRRLESIVLGIATTLAQDDFTYTENSTYEITVEAIGSGLTISQDGAVVFTVTDGAIAAGRIGLYSDANGGSQFGDVRVDDFRAVAPVVYTFSFTTSAYVDVFHHAHSYQDETWPAPIAAAIDLSASIAAAVASPSPAAAPVDAETRAYETLATAVFGQQATSAPAEVDVSQIQQNATALALVVQSPEPLDWTRTSMAFSSTSRTEPPRTVPGSAKMTDVSFGASPNAESVSVLLRDALDLSQYSIAQRVLPDPLEQPSGDVLLYDDFTTGPLGVLYRETFPANALNFYQIVDQGTAFGPSAWNVTGGTITQTSSILTLPLGHTNLRKLGTMAIVGQTSWTAVRVRATMTSGTNGALGIVFRYTDEKNYYRFSLDDFDKTARLVKVTAGTFSQLWHETYHYTQNVEYDVHIVAYGSTLIGYLNGTYLFSVTDGALTSGAVGFYSWANSDATFSALRVDSLATQPVLWQPPFADMTGLNVVDASGAAGAPSQWNVAGGKLVQSANIALADATLFRNGTYAVAGDRSWSDLAMSAQLETTTGGGIGLLFRYSNDNNYYRFALDTTLGKAWLLKRVGGVVTVLASVASTFAVNAAAAVTVIAEASRLSVYVNGAAVIDVADGDLVAGLVGFYSYANAGATFSDVLVVDRALDVGQWTVHDEGQTAGPSVWVLAGGELVQKTSIGDPTLPEAVGTIVTAGSAGWTDYRLTATMRSDTDQAIGLVFRYVDDNNYYRLSMDSSRGYRRLIKNNGGVLTTLWQDGVAYGVGGDTTFVIDATGSHLVGYADGGLLFDLHDGSNAAGAVGLYAWNNDAARFTFVEVTTPPLISYALFIDAFLTGSISAWSFVDDSTTNAPSHWALGSGALAQTSTIAGTQAVAGDASWTDVIADVVMQCGDGGTIGAMVRYTDANHYYLFSMNSTTPNRSLVKNVGGTTTTLWEDAAEYDKGTPIRLTMSAIGGELRGYLDGVLTFVVEDSSLTNGLIGLFTSGTGAAAFLRARVYPAPQTSADAVFTDNFIALVTNTWTFVDVGTTNVRSNWKVDGTIGLEQTSRIDGTYALAGTSTWTDYRYVVRLSTSKPGTVGAAFRVTDQNNLYRFTFERIANHGKRTLERLAGGASTVLWSDTVAVALKREYVLTVDAVGDRLTVYVDGVQLCAVSDATYTTGLIGLYTSGDVGASFREVSVTPLAWQTYYTFADEMMQEPGTRLQIFSGNGVNAPPAIPNVSYRFVATLNDGGETHFGNDAVDLQLLDPTQKAVHARRFFTLANYSTLNAKVIRRGDGTGFVVAVPAAGSPGSQFTAGQVRITLTYLRDNTAAVPTSQVLTEEGSSQPEVVTLDVPWIVPPAAAT